MFELLNNPYFILFLAVLVVGLGYVFWRPEAIPAFLFLLLSGLEGFYEFSNIQKVALLKAVILPVLLVVVLLQKFRSRGRLPLAGPVCVLCYLALVVLSCLINGADIEEYRGTVGILLIPLVVGFCSNNEKTVKFLTIAIAFWGFINLMVVAATWAGMGWARGLVTADETHMTNRLQGLMGLSTDMGIYFAISLNAVQVLYYQVKTRKGRLGLFTLGAGLALGLIGTVSVGAIAACGVSFLYIQHRLRGLTVANLIAIGGLAILILGFAAFLNMDTIMVRVSTLSSDKSALGRLTLIKMGITRFLKSPLFGVGLNQGGSPHLEAHNTYLQVLMENGIIGFSLFCATLWCGVRGLRQKALWDQKTGPTPVAAYYVGLLGMLGALLLDGTVHVFDFYVPLWLILGIGFMV